MLEHGCDETSELTCAAGWGRSDRHEMTADDYGLEISLPAAEAVAEAVAEAGARTAFSRTALSKTAFST